jgi:hypothetical protein
MLNSTRLTLAAAALALATVPAFAQTTKEMGKDSSMGTSSSDPTPATTRNGMAASKSTGSTGMKKDDGMSSGNRASSSSGTGTGTGTRGEDNSGKTTSGNTQGK